MAGRFHTHLKWSVWLVLQYIWDKYRQIIFELVEIQSNGKGVTEKSKLDYIRGVLIYVA